MNRVFLSGMIANDPSHTSSENGIERLTFQLCIKHRTLSGIIHKEYYTINAWNETAKWAKRNLSKGGFIALQGYLTQKTIKTSDGASVVVTSVAVDEFIVGALPTAVNNHEPAAAEQEAVAEGEKKTAEAATVNENEQ